MSNLIHEFESRFSRMEFVTEILLFIFGLKFIRLLNILPKTLSYEAHLFETIFFHCIRKDSESNKLNQKNNSLDEKISFKIHSRNFRIKFLNYLKGDFISHIAYIVYFFLFFGPIILYALELWQTSTLQFWKTIFEDVNFIWKMFSEFVMKQINNTTTNLTIIFNNKILKILFLYKLFLSSTYFITNFFWAKKIGLINNNFTAFFVHVFLYVSVIYYGVILFETYAVKESGLLCVALFILLIT